ncbi:MAG: alpha/beta fold hydrolase [Chloroflexi bacterium]|nr:alpha/beta fold hydrolase [Chloroflexota bacterium]
MPLRLRRLNLLSDNDLVTFLREEATFEEIRTIFGRRAEEIRRNLSEESKSHREGDSLIIVLPGFIASNLVDTADPTRDDDDRMLWLNPGTFIRGDLNKLDLADDGLNNLDPAVRIEAQGIVWPFFAKMVLRLQRDFEVATFPYDWRLPTPLVAQQLMDYIDARLHDSSHDQVTLVAHSLGGLVALDYLTGAFSGSHAQQKVARVITLGTPYRGSVGALSTMATLTQPALKLAKRLNPANDPMRMFRSFPSLYQLLPAPPELYDNWDVVPEIDLWDARVWLDQDIPINEEHLKMARQHHTSIAQADPQVPLYTIAGTNNRTALKLFGPRLDAEPVFGERGVESGDNTVAVEAARFRDRPAYYVHEIHTELVLETTVIEGVQAWVRGEEPDSLVTAPEEVPLEMTTRSGPVSTFDETLLVEKANKDEDPDYEDLHELYKLMGNS